MLYKINSEQDIFELNPGLRAIKEYNALTPRQMLFVCLVSDVDFDNPLRSLPEMERREKAAKVAGYPTDTDGKRLDKNGRNLVHGKVESVEAAIAEYRNLQFDEDKANLQAIENQIEEIRWMMNLKKEDAAKITKTKKNKETKEEETTTYVDYDLAFNLAEKSAKLGASLAKLVETKKELKAKVQAKEPIKFEVSTYTAGDIAQQYQEEETDSSLSTIDQFMATRK